MNFHNHSQAVLECTQKTIHEFEIRRGELAYQRAVMLLTQSGLSHDEASYLASSGIYGSEDDLLDAIYCIESSRHMKMMKLEDVNESFVLPSCDSQVSISNQSALSKRSYSLPRSRRERELDNTAIIDGSRVIPRRVFRLRASDTVVQKNRLSRSHSVPSRRYGSPVMNEEEDDAVRKLELFSSSAVVLCCGTHQYFHVVSLKHGLVLIQNSLSNTQKLFD